jgi:two-component system, OmpR family, sensor kinase
VTLRRALVLALAYVLLLAIIALGVPSALNLRTRVDAEVRSEARGQADVVAATASDLLGSGRAAARRDLVQRAATSLRGRVLLVDPDGTVLADSAGTEAVGEDYGSRPEIASALRGDAVQERRRSDTLDEELLATAVPIARGPSVLGAVRVTQSVTAVDRATWRAMGGIAVVGFVVLAIGLVAGAVISRALSRPLARLEAVARRIASGDLASRAPVEGTAEQRSLAQSFNDMADGLQEALEGQRHFVADASHQLRTPLTGVRLRLEEARATTPDDDPAAEELDAGMHEVDRLAAIVEDLLTLSRAGQAGGRVVAVDTMAAVQATADRFNAHAAEREVRLSVHGAAGVARVPAAALDRVLDALVENAIAYSPPGAEVELAVEDGRIAVMDRGPGLAPGEEEAVFARFHRGSASLTGVRGTGLGLAIARQLAREWGGEVTISNRRDGGARAVIVLPARVPEEVPT